MSEIGTTEFNQFELDANARYIKLIGFGRFNSAGDERKSIWSAVGEIEFYKASTLSVNENRIINKISFFPVPFKELLNIKSGQDPIEKVIIYNITGKKVFEKKLNKPLLKLNLNLSFLDNGLYIVKTYNGIKMITKVISKLK